MDTRKTIKPYQSISHAILFVQGTLIFSHASALLEMYKIPIIQTSTATVRRPQG